MSKNVLGQFEHQVLLAILALGAEAYSVEVVLELERHLEREVSTAAVFVALQRLKAKGYLTAQMVEPGPQGGHARRYFRPTAKALTALREARRGFLSLWGQVGRALDETGR